MLGGVKGLGIWHVTAEIKKRKKRGGRSPRINLK